MSNNNTDLPANLSTSDITKSVDQLCAQLSINNITVPKIDAYKDVFEYLNEFETATETLSTSQRIKLLVKSFPPGRLRAWYDTNILGLSDWSTVKGKIIKRFSDTEDRDKHLTKLQSLKYNPSGSNKLFDFVDEVIYSFSKAFPNLKDEESKIRYVKTMIPKPVQATLLSMNDFSSTNLDTFMDSIKQYDKLRANTGDDEASEKLKSSELLTIIKSLVEEVKKENQATSKRVVAALEQRAPSPSTPLRSLSPYHQSRSRQRSVSPNNRQNQEVYNEYQQRSSNYNYNRSHNRTPSPRRNNTDFNQNYRNNYYPISNYNVKPYPNDNFYGSRQENNNYYPRSQTSNNFDRPMRRQGSPSPNHAGYNNNYRYDSNYNQINNRRPREAFNNESYYQRFGYPPTSCSHCGDNHWDRHCHIHLN